MSVSAMMVQKAQLALKDEKTVFITGACFSGWERVDRISLTSADVVEVEIYEVGGPAVFFLHIAHVFGLRIRT